MNHLLFEQHHTQPRPHKQELTTLRLLFNADTHYLNHKSWVFALARQIIRSGELSWRLLHSRLFLASLFLYFPCWAVGSRA
ncbi:hypothetical protein L207DRAFT_512249 [Hyaloscypha variabilis F]|uniref:Uncharacterized protein n=1 Tax=Hyaloscypha variabilis (strain UAMH 11265 / GT02V1 / F) TaxID=1149755 RepID=A0A2J6RQL0_HYAVF|nr:hypothetical protein L207DRAFT_512249 [Hyaloscypha variabilis F]